MRKHAALLVFLAALIFFSIGAASKGLWHADEHRIAEVAREMAVPGGDWIVPHLAGETYTHKPPLVPWIAAVAHGSLGLDLALAAKVPSILGAALAALGTFLIGRRLYGDAAGLAGAGVLVTAVEFDWICRRSQYDPLLTGFATLALWFFVRSHFACPDGERRSPWSDAIAGSLCAGLAILVKGPVAFVFLVPTVLLFVLFTRERRDLATPRLAALPLVLVPGGVWLAAAVSRSGLGFADELVRGQAVGHAVGGVDKLEPWWFYLVAFPKGFAPWTLLLPAAVIASTSRRRDVERRADVFVLVWFVASFALMSISPAKRDIYLLPLYPPAAICVAKLVAAGDRVAVALFAFPRVVIGAAALSAGLAAIAIATMVMIGADVVLAERVAWWTTVRGGQGLAGPILAVVAGIFLAGFGWKVLRAPSGADAMDQLTATALVGTLGFAAVLLPCADPAQSPRLFYERAAALAGAAPIGRYGVDDFAGHWVMGRTDLPFLEGPAAVRKFLAGTTGPAFVVVERSTLDRRGVPPGTRIVLEEKLPLAKDLLLLTRE